MSNEERGMSQPTKSDTDRIKKKAQQLGFELVGIALATPHEDMTFFDAWLEKEYAGTMAYLARRRDDRADPKRLLAGAQTIICCGINYNGEETNSQDCATEDRGWISRYAWGDDYHDVVLAKLKELETFIRDSIDASALLKSYVDTGPILERSYAASAGLGWIGKNTMLINRKIGSYFFIGTILTNLDLVPDAPETDHCGTCRLCIDACPTEALTPYELDATQCISYLTIEHRGEIDTHLREKIGHHLVGCDICQEVCPWNQAIPLSPVEAFQPRPGLHRPDLSQLENLDEAGFREKFRNSAIKRVKPAGLKRNLAIVRRNQERDEC